jgi:hypothetical protein
MISTPKVARLEANLRTLSPIRMPGPIPVAAE